MSSPSLAIPHVAAAQNQKEVTINDAIDALDRALTDLLEVDLSTGNGVVAAADLRRAMVIRATGPFGAPRSLTLPAIRRLCVAVNGDAAEALMLIRGATSLTLAPGAARLLYLDGTADGVQPVGAGDAAAAGATGVYDFGVSVQAPPPPDAVLGKVVLPRAVTLPADLTGMAGHVDTPPAAPFAIALTADGSPIGEITVATDGSFTCATNGNAAIALSAGAVIRFLAPATADAQIAGLSLTLAGDLA